MITGCLLTLSTKEGWFRSQRTHRVAMATFWRTFHHDGKIIPATGEGWGEGASPSPFTISTITYKVAVHAPAERAETLPLFLLYPCMYSLASLAENWAKKILRNYHNMARCGIDSWKGGGLVSCKYKGQSFGKLR
jgi:hypothetical protein